MPPLVPDIGCLCVTEYLMSLVLGLVYNSVSLGIFLLRLCVIELHFVSLDFLFFDAMANRLEFI
ncbi:hypothetical protein QBC38DRAFT_470420 [Podospora fimiseda]|uniref:Uncharacterized protein n=1 Tax=Podospora fimiseda TaxID=252190 RepID=A0AAN7H5Y7_9PEZI|nr:hypothetical protein QBC38DRAFT_470420 [Podospora fimiseda]